MPIKDPKIYPPYWKQFSEYIRFERAESRCEQCGIENKSVNVRGSKVVLTVAHLDHEGGPCQCRVETGYKCTRPDHVLALCQACHLALDLPKHIERARQTRIDKKDAERPLLQKWLD